MATKTISTILNLRDNMSTGLLKAAKGMKEVDKNAVSATRSVLAFGKKAEQAATQAVKSFGKAATKAAALGVAAATAATAAAAKVGFSEALDLEGYRLQLETATKDTEKASQIMQYAIDLANKTPFEGGALVEGAAKFEAMGMAAETWLTRAGDMAAATNKDFDQAVEALIDAQNGELERLKEFGITKAKILEQGEKMFAGVQIANNSGTIVNQEKFNEALIALMEDRFSGGMEKQATTVKGLWSTVTGVTKSALASMVGMSTDGSIRAGSALDLIKGKVSGLAERFQQWQQDGTLDKLATKIDQGLGKAMELAGKAFDVARDGASALFEKFKQLQEDGTIDRLASQIGDGLSKGLELASNAFSWIVNNWDTVQRVLGGIAAAFAAIKVLEFASGVITAAKTVGSFLSVAGTFLAANPVVLGIAAAIAAGAFLIANWDKVKETASNLWEGAKNIFGGIRDTVTGAFQAAKDAVAGFFSWIGDKLTWLNDKVEGVPILGNIYKNVKSQGSAVISGVQAAGSWVSQKLRGNALGTSYYSGGVTRINERGGEIVDLPSGTRIIPHDVAAKTGGPNVRVTVYIKGNVIGNAQYADELGGVIVRKLLAAMDNS